MSSWVRSGALVGAPDLIRRLGGDPAALALAAGIDAAAFNDPDFPVPTGAVVGFFEAAAASCRCENFGLRLARQQDLSLLGPLWPLMQSAATVGEMLQDLARYFLLHTTGALLSIESSRRGLILDYSLSTGTSATDRHTMELGIALLVHELRKSRPNWWPGRVLFRHGPPQDPRLHRQVLGPHVFFNADRNALFVDPEILAAPYGSGDALVHQQLTSSLGARRRQLPELLRARTETVIRSLISFSPCDVAIAAGILHLSHRSLQRKLAEEKTSFSEILDAVRADLALKYLRQSDLQIAAIAEILGFSETSTLTRAFRRWYGQSPRRAKHSPPR
jgi:AraC-like DNA-binding protein